MASLARQARRRHEDGESVFVSMTDLSVSFLFILLILLAFFATQFHAEEFVPLAVHQAEIAKRNKIIQKVQAQRDAASAAVRKLEDQVSLLQTKMRDLDRQIEGLEEEVRRLQVAKLGLERSVEQLRVDVDRRDQRIEGLEQEIRELEENELLLNRRIKGLEEENESLEVAKVGLEKVVEQLRDDLANRERRIGNLEHEIEQWEDKVLLLERRIDDLQMEVRNRDRRIEVLNREVVRLKDRVDLLRRLARDPLAMYLQDATNQRNRLLAEIKKRIEESAGIKVTIDKESGLIRLSADELFASGQWRVIGQEETKVHQIAVAIADGLLDVLPPYTFGAESRFDRSANPADALIETVQIEGHTDAVPVSGRGELLDNLDLSARRGAEMFRVMVAQEDGRLKEFRNLSGLPILSFSGYGEMRPLERLPGMSDDDYNRQNRRIDLRVILQTPQNMEEVQRIRDRLAESRSAPVRDD